MLWNVAGQKNYYFQSSNQIMPTSQDKHTEQKFKVSGEPIGFNKNAGNASPTDAQIEEQRALYESLTDQEKKIVCFLGRGYRQQAIALIFQMSTNTFQHHRINIFRKLRFTNNVQMINWCHQYLDIFFEKTFRVWNS